MILCLKCLESTIVTHARVLNPFFDLSIVFGEVRNAA